MLITLVRTLNNWVVAICQLLALFVIVTGIIKALIIYCKHVFSNSRSALAFQASRLELGYSFSLGLSFLVGGSILKTTVAPTWNDIGQLAAIIALRTVLNYLLLQAINNGSTDESQTSLLSAKESKVSLTLEH
ncbi:MAG: hypothetical protein Kow0049_35700 [Stanieria sp.]